MKFLVIIALLIATASAQGANRTTVTPANETHLPLPSKLYHIVSPVWQVANASNQRIMHTYCAMNETSGCAECLLFNSDKEGAKLIGTEYLVTRELFTQLPLQERQLWHSHAYEVKNGLVSLPDEARAVEDQALAILANSYGKSFAMNPGMASFEELRESLLASNRSANATRLGTFRALQAHTHPRHNRTGHAAAAPKLNEQTFPFAIPQFFTTFTEKGPKMNKAISERLNKIGKEKIEDRKRRYANLTIAEKVEGADFWETNQGIQLDVVQLRLRNGTAQQAIRNRTHPLPHHGGGHSRRAREDQEESQEENQEESLEESQEQEF